MIAALHRFLEVDGASGRRARRACLRGGRLTVSAIPTTEIQRGHAWVEYRARGDTLMLLICREVVSDSGSRSSRVCGLHIVMLFMSNTNGAQAACINSRRSLCDLTEVSKPANPVPEPGAK